MSETKDERIHEFLVACRADQFAFLTSIINVVSENPPGESQALCERVAEMIAQHELPVTIHELPKEVVQGSAYENLANLVVRREFAPGPTVALSTHLDTAPAGGQWKHDAFGAEIVDGRMYGRGTSEGKGDLAAYLYALLALDSMADQLAGSVELHLTFDGMAGGELGVKWLLESEFVKPDLAIVPGAARAIGTASTGVLNLGVEIRGRSAPAGRPGSGADAIEGAAPILGALYDYRDSLGNLKSKIPGIASPTMVITEISGGASPLMVPDQVHFSIDRRVLPEEAPDTVEAEITNVIGRSAAQVPGVICKVRRRRLLPSFHNDDRTKAFAQVLAGHLENVVGEAPVEYGVSHETPARHYANAGVPAILYGAGPDFLEPPMSVGPDEFLELDDLRISTEVLSKAMADWLQGPQFQSDPAPETEEATTFDEEPTATT